MFAALGLLAACANPDAGNPHPPNVLDYPLAVTADPSGDHIWVTSANFDLAWRGGAILAIDVTNHTYVSDGDTPAEGLPGVAQVGGFPGPVHLLERDGEAVSAYVLSRADDSLYHLNITTDNGLPQLDCEGAAVQENGVIACNSSQAFHSGSYPVDGETAEGSVGPDPYGAIVHHARDGGDQDLLLTGAMIDGNIAVFGLGLQGGQGTPRLLTETNITNGLFAFAQSPKTGHIITGHKSLNVFNVLRVVPPPANEADPTLYDTPTLEIVKTIVVPAGVVRDYARGLAVSSDGTRLYAAYRSPSSLLVLDIAAGAEATPDERLLAKIPLGHAPADVVVVPAEVTHASGKACRHPTELVYVSAYGNERIDVVDPNLGVVVDTIQTRQGPFGMDYICNPDKHIDRLYVALFHEQSVGVIELDATSPYRHTLVAEIR